MVITYAIRLQKQLVVNKGNSSLNNVFILFAPICLFAKHSSFLFGLKFPVFPGSVFVAISSGLIAGDKQRQSQSEN